MRGFKPISIYVIFFLLLFVVAKNALPNSEETISLNLQHMKVRTALLQISDLSGMNIIIHPSVKGELNLHLNKVAWQDALEVIIQTCHLQKRQIGNILYIFSSDFDEKNSSKDKVRQDTWGFQHFEELLYNPIYTKASELADLLQNSEHGLLSSDGHLTFDDKSNVIWIFDSPRFLKNINVWLKKIDIPIQQVLIEARIVHAGKDFARDLGVRFGTISQYDENPGKVEVGADVKHKNRLKTSSQRFNVDLGSLPVGNLSASSGLVLAKLGSNILLDLELSALESEGRGEVIASPKLLTANRQEATIESGEEIPYQEISQGGATAVAFRKAVLSLRVTPYIHNNDSLILDLKIHQDMRGEQTFVGVPVILTKQLQTQALVKNQETIVLGGIYKREQTNIVNRVPILGTLPIVKNLFRQTIRKFRSEELLIFIRPTILPAFINDKTE